MQGGDGQAGETWLYTFVSFRASEVKGLMARTTWDMERLRLATGSLQASVLGTGGDGHRPVASRGWLLHSSPCFQSPSALHHVPVLHPFSWLSQHPIAWIHPILCVRLSTDGDVDGFCFSAIVNRAGCTSFRGDTCLGHLGQKTGVELPSHVFKIWCFSEDGWGL